MNYNPYFSIIYHNNRISSIDNEFLSKLLNTKIYHTFIYNKTLSQM